MTPEEPKRSGIPWKAIAKNMAYVGGGYLAGHLGAGVAMKGLQHTNAGRWFRNLSPRRQAVIRRRVGLTAGMVGSAASIALPYARDAHMQQEAEKMHKKGSATEGRVSQVYMAYAVALERG